MLANALNLNMSENLALLAILREKNIGGSTGRVRLRACEAREFPWARMV